MGNSTFLLLLFVAVLSTQISLSAAVHCHTTSPSTTPTSSRSTSTNTTPTTTIGMTTIPTTTTIATTTPNATRQTSPVCFVIPKSIKNPVKKEIRDIKNLSEVIVIIVKLNASKFKDLIEKRVNNIKDKVSEIQALLRMSYVDVGDLDDLVEEALKRVEKAKKKVEKGGKSNVQLAANILKSANELLAKAIMDLENGKCPE